MRSPMLPRPWPFPLTWPTRPDCPVAPCVCSGANCFPRKIQAAGLPQLRPLLWRWGGLFLLLRGRRPRVCAAVLVHHLLRRQRAGGGGRQSCLRRVDVAAGGRVQTVRRCASTRWDRRCVGAGQHKFGGRVLCIAANQDVIVRRAIHQRSQNLADRPWPILAEDALVAGQPQDFHPSAMGHLCQYLREAGIFRVNGQLVVLELDGGRDGWLLCRRDRP